MQPVETLMLRVAAVCERLGLDYFVTGSVGAMFWGEPRGTLDVDMVLELSAGNVGAFCEAFPQPNYYVEPESATQAVKLGGQFNIIDVNSGVKADIMVFRGSPFDRSRLIRARLVKFGDSDLKVATPEDIILKKLEYYREGGSDKHLRDIGGILRVSADQVDKAYVRQWAGQIDVMSEWERVCGHLGIAP